MKRKIVDTVCVPVEYVYVIALIINSLLSLIIGLDCLCHLMTDDIYVGGMQYLKLNVTFYLNRKTFNSQSIRNNSDTNLLHIYMYVLYI